MTYRKLNKKGDESVKTLVQIILFIGLFFIAYKLFNGLMDWWVGGSLHEGTVKSIERIKIEAENMVKDEASFPVFVDNNHQIFWFKEGKGRLLCKEGKSCICICSKDSQCENNAVKKCEISSAVPLEDYTLMSRKDKNEKPIAYNCNLIKKEQFIQVQC